VAILFNSQSVSRQRKEVNIRVEVVSITATKLVVAGVARIAVRTTVVRIILVLLVVANATLAMIASVIKGTNVSRGTSRMIVRGNNMEVVCPTATVVITRIVLEVVVIARVEMDTVLIHRLARTVRRHQVAVDQTR